MLKPLIAILAVIATCSVHVQTACDFPKQFEGHMSIERVSFLVNDKPMLMTEEVQFSYDSVNKRSYQREVVRSEGKKTESFTLTLAKENVTYTFENTQCSRGPSGNWIQLDVPEQAVGGRPYYMGPDRCALVTDYDIDNGPGVTTTLTISENCTPVMMKQLTLFEKGGEASVVMFENITHGIQTLSVFKVPRACQQLAEDMYDYDDDETQDYVQRTVGRM